ncbi:hypothetical protein LR48_Vigan11g063600 [Vigna angularis]|uniref:Putative plant transposon protein domain-containing protein n=1 Tax=Phaseolus angularis TaxID=3914 RepID=A0A0L9VRM9_PHAAN|nr:hypothetical protein LR48_Vigan11g063600 [Vigna angularis]
MERKVGLIPTMAPEFGRELGRRQWENVASYPSPANIVVVKEFYTNSRGFGNRYEGYSSYVRGKRIPYDTDTINSFLGSEWTRKQCQFALAMEEDINYADVEQTLCMLGGRNLNVNIGQVIADEISVCANTSNNKAPLGHPSLITHLCKIVGVDTSAPPFERPRKAIDEAYYIQYCGGEEAAQPVLPRRARRERGPAQSQTSVETHEAEPFQMRDMYMSLIGAQLQSIHRGQVATAEMILGMYDTPPAHRWTMDEFHNVVAWPEEPVQREEAEAAEASVREMEEDEADDDDAFEDAEDEEEEEDTEDNSD